MQVQKNELFYKASPGVVSSPTKDYIFFFNSETEFSVYDIEENKFIQQKVKTGTFKNEVSWSDNGEYFLSLCDSSVVIYDNQFNEVGLHHHFNELNDAKFSPSSKNILLPHSMQVINLDGKLVTEYKQFSGYMDEADFLSDGKIVYTNLEGSMKIWNWYPVCLIYEEEYEKYCSAQIQTTDKYFFQFKSECLPDSGSIPLSKIAKMVLPNGSISYFSDTVLDVKSLAQPIPNLSKNEVLMAYDNTIHIFHIKEKEILKKAQIPLSSKLLYHNYIYNDTIFTITQNDSLIHFAQYDNKGILHNTFSIRDHNLTFDESWNNIEIYNEQDIIIFSSSYSSAIIISLRKNNAKILHPIAFGDTQFSTFHFLENGKWISTSIYNDTTRESFSYLWSTSQLFDNKKSYIETPDTTLIGRVNNAGDLISNILDSSIYFMDSNLVPVFNIRGHSLYEVSQNEEYILTASSPWPDDIYNTSHLKIKPTLWNKQGDLIAKLEVDDVFAGNIIGFKFLPKHNRILGLFTSPTQFHLWDMKGELVSIINKNDAVISNVSYDIHISNNVLDDMNFPEDGVIALAVSCYDGKTYLLDKDGNVLGNFTADDDMIFHNEFYRDDKFFWIESETGYKIWNVNVENILQQTDWVDPLNNDLLKFIN